MRWHPTVSLRSRRRPALSVRSLVDAHQAAGGTAAYTEGLSWHSITWDQVGASAADWRANRSAVSGSRHRLRVGLAVADPVSMASCVLGALAAGVTIAPLDAGATAEELATRCDVLGLSAVVTDRDDDRLMARLAAGSSDVWGISGDGLHQLTARRGPAGPPAVGDGAIILCGAATPGRPRVTTLSEADILGAAAAVVERHHIGPDDRGYSPLPLFQADGLVAGVFSNLVAGSTLILDRRFAAGRFWPTVQRHGATWVNLLPAMISVLAAQAPPGPAPSTTVRFARSTSAPLASATIARFERRCAVPVFGTGATAERAVRLGADLPGDHDNRSGAIAWPLGA
ncbi:MAG TPA: AMP-binding protein [Acidimicrobiales bacterium]|jgi:acyl-CoA synthetase (AMP-forming)/AMP-acid ligase II